MNCLGCYVPSKTHNESGPCKINKEQFNATYWMHRAITAEQQLKETKQ